MVTVIFDILEPPLFENIGVGSFKHFVFVFLAVHNSSIGNLVTHSLTDRTFTFDITE